MSSLGLFYPTEHGVHDSVATQARTHPQEFTPPSKEKRDLDL